LQRDTSTGSARAPESGRPFPSRPGTFSVLPLYDPSGSENEMRGTLAIFLKASQNARAYFDNKEVGLT